MDTRGYEHRRTGDLAVDREERPLVLRETVVAGEREQTGGALAGGRDRDRAERALLGLHEGASLSEGALVMRSIARKPSFKEEICQPRSRARHAVAVERTRLVAVMAAAARNVIRSKRNPGGRSKPTAAATRQRDALDGDPQLQPGMDQVRVLSHCVLVRFVELGPTLGVAHLRLRDVRERVSRLDDVRPCAR